MVSKERIGIMAMIAIVLLLAPSFVLAESGGTINFTNIYQNASVVTGLWGVTQTTTTSTTSTTSSSSSDSESAGPNISTGLTTTTVTAVASTTTTTMLFPYDHYSAGVIEKKYSAVYMNSVMANTTSIGEKLNSYFGNSNPIDDQASAELNNNIAIIKSLDIYSDHSSLDVRIFYNGSERRNVMIYDIVPKAFASSADNITITTKENYSIVEKDPAFLFLVSSIKQQDVVSINYIVNRKVSPNVINYTSIVVFAGPQSTWPDIFTITITFIVIIAIFAVIIVLREQLAGVFEKDHHVYKHVHEKPSKLGDIIRKIKEKLFRKREPETSFIYKYQNK